MYTDTIDQFSVYTTVTVCIKRGESVIMCNAEQLEQVYQYLLDHDQIDPRYIDTHRLSACRWISEYLAQQSLTAVTISFHFNLINRKRMASTDDEHIAKRRINDGNYLLTRPADQPADQPHNPAGTTRPEIEPNLGSRPNSRNRNHSDSTIDLDTFNREYHHDLSALRQAERDEQRALEEAREFERRYMYRSERIFEADENQAREEERAHQNQVMDQEQNQDQNQNQATSGPSLPSSGKTIYSWILFTVGNSNYDVILGPKSNDSADPKNQAFISSNNVLRVSAEVIILISYTKQYLCNVLGNASTYSIG